MEFEQLITLIQTVSEASVRKFRYEQDGMKLCIEKETASTVPDMTCVMPNTAAPVMHVQDESSVSAATSGQPDHSGKLIKSPLIGRFYAAPAEDAAAFVAVGDHVKKGQIVAIVEAMKLMNEIESEFDGIVDEILVENGEVVEYGQPLFRIK